MSAVAWALVGLQAASLTLMAEWGDRSQLATFALAADRSASAVCLGKLRFVFGSLDLAEIIWATAI